MKRRYNNVNLQRTAAGNTVETNSSTTDHLIRLCQSVELLQNKTIKIIVSQA